MGIAAQAQHTFESQTMRTTSNAGAPVRRAPTARIIHVEPGPAELAADWVQRRYRVTPAMAAAIATAAGLGGLAR